MSICQADSIAALTANADLVLSGNGTGGVELGTNIKSGGSPFTGGKVVQTSKTIDATLASGTTSIPYDDTIPQTTEGTKFIPLDTTITPTNASNLLKVSGILNITSVGSNHVTIYLTQDASTIAFAVFNVYETSSNPAVRYYEGYITAGTTSATAIHLYYGNSGGTTCYINGDGGIRKYGGKLFSTMLIEEIQP